MIGYLRARRVPAAVAVSAGAVALVTVLWAVLEDDRAVHRSLAVLTTALALAPLVPTLAGNDVALERTAALPWPPRRMLHLLACGALVAGLLCAARAAGVDFGPGWQVVRNAAGLAGLAGLTAGAFGAGYAWQLPVGWAAVQAFTPVRAQPAWREAAAWMVQPAGSRTAAVVACALLVAGLAAYAVRVGPSGPGSAASEE
ncbi:hypothetical protein [Catenuloplanes atrovinosus]|uniref:Uncharacterized protein n=1 Tax=Catenuloplanes atrovinosus TaxID=137266 RepID=A0AAE3YKI8_9ACTN|nr:hypothetical protein [Catenuloplanes atrovinosus]MDR7275479.1 hypothetical protein [Catenuloplanes atrovinosus]